MWQGELSGEARWVAVAAPASPRRLFGRPSGDQRPVFLPRPLAIPCSPRSCSRPLWLGSVGLRVSAPAPADGAGPTPRLGVPLPQQEIGGAENRNAGDPQASGAAHRLRTRQRSAPETRLASSSALSRGRPPTPTRTLVDLGAAPYNRSRCCSHAFRETTQKDSADSGVQFITPAGPRQSLLLAKDPDQFL